MSDAAAPWVCATCGGIGFVYHAAGGVERVARCRCRVPAAGPDRFETIPPAYRHCTLGNFEPRTAVLGAALAATLAYCHGFPHEGRDRGLGLLFWGGGKTGKTHLAVAAAQEILANHALDVAFWDFSALLKEVGRGYDKSSHLTELGALQSAMRVDLLVLDDLASRRMHDWMQNALFEILDARYRQRLPTILTTPFEPGDPGSSPHARYKREEFLVERVGARLQSRIEEMCSLVATHGPRERAAGAWTGRPSDLRGLRRGHGAE